MRRSLGRWNGITGSTLKMVAIITMFLDHVAAIVIQRYVAAAPFSGMSTEMGALWDRVYFGLRVIGRLGFPIFCFLLLEGYDHTRSRSKYALRLGVFALISEIPFDLAFQDKVLETTYQNVFFTLLFGLLSVWAVDVFCRWMDEKGRSQAWMLLRWGGAGVIALTGMLVADWFHTDYGFWGVAAILGMFLGRRVFLSRTNGMGMALGCGILIYHNLVELSALLCIPLAVWYNGKRGWNVKYVFYAFYPVHILLLYGICRWLGV